MRVFYRVNEEELMNKIVEEEVIEIDINQMDFVDDLIAVIVKSNRENNGVPDDEIHKNFEFIIDSPQAVKEVTGRRPCNGLRSTGMHSKYFNC
jgi:hypothetical protein